MPLSPPVERNCLHNRTYDFQGYQRADGLWDIEGRIVDTKTYPFANHDRGEIAPGEALHDMSIRLTIDEDFKVHDIEAVTDFSPFTLCPDITPNFKRMIGSEIRSGWTLQVRKTLGGVEGCTHLVDLLNAMATVAFQTLYPVRAAKAAKRQPGERPGLLNTCHAFAPDSPIVKRSWPDFYTGKD
ncbi:DUF2889 domain-containing protein [Pelagibius sp. 7325]|uniref:DUF2889 domain-containing protein n=1 Tax=Pelagibius sp. 7325 TaxID=3131994 RepID=UPI0030EDDA26